MNSQMSRFCIVHHAFRSPARWQTMCQIRILHIHSCIWHIEQTTCVRPFQISHRTALLLLDRQALTTGCYLLHHYGGVYLDVWSLDATGHSIHLETYFNLSFLSLLLRSIQFACKALRVFTILSKATSVMLWAGTSEKVVENFNFRALQTHTVNYCKLCAID